ncbi:potassium transporter TrkG [Actinomycetes bacterium KLBMP 9797]
MPASAAMSSRLVLANPARANAWVAYVMWSEMRGESSVIVGRRRIPAGNQRQALTIALLGIGAVAVSTFTLLALTHHSLDLVLFEAVSAFGTVGLSAGITADLPPAGVLLLVGLMFVGRVGPLTVASALATAGADPAVRTARGEDDRWLASTTNPWWCSGSAVSAAPWP